MRNWLDSLVVKYFQRSSSQSCFRKSKDIEPNISTSNEDRIIQKDEGGVDPSWPEASFSRDVIGDKAKLHNKELDEKQKEMKK